jgi:hypothetical protein
MQHANDNTSNGRQVYRTPGLQAWNSPKRKLLLLGTCALLAGLALGLFALVSPTTPASAAPPRNPGLLSTNPSVLDNLGTNRACSYDTHGGAPYIFCTITLKNTSNRSSVKWTAKVTTSPAAAVAVKLFPANGTVSVERRGRVTIDRSQFVRITVPASWGCRNATIFFYAPGTPQLSRPQNILTWSCPHR